MLKSGLFNLVSGTDIRGVAVGSEDNITLTDDAVFRIACAFVKWINAKYGLNSPAIAVGNDCRISSPRILSAVKKALIESGCKVICTGLSSTPSMFMILKHRDIDASVMITASHMPADKNGLKFFTKSGGIDKKDLNGIISLAEKGERLYGEGSCFEQPFMDEYSEILVNKVENECGKLPLKGKKIIVDAGNGVGGFFAEKVLKPLGADTQGSQFLEPDGNFPNHIPNPEDRDAILSLGLAVIRNNADLGIIFDTDVDRAALVDANGVDINRNRLIALITAILFGEKCGVIVTDSVTCDSLTDFIESLGGKHLRYKRGYKNVIDKCIELNGSGIYSPLAIETSGHAAFKDNYYLDDGAYLVVKLLTSFAKLSKAGKSLNSLIENFKEPEEEIEIRLNFNKNSKDFKLEGEKVIKELTEIARKDKNIYLSPENYEGVKMSFEEGSVIVRMSVHDPVMPINAESNRVGGTKKVLKKLYNYLKVYSFLDTSNLQNIIF